MQELPHEELLSGYLDGELEPSERAVVERILRVNADARQLLDELRTLRETIKSLPRYKLCPPLPQRSFAEEVLRRAQREMLLQPDAHAESRADETHEPAETVAAPHLAAAAVAAATNSTGYAQSPAAAAVFPRRTAEDGNGWKRVLAAGMVLTASVALIVLAQPGDRQPSNTVVQDSLGPTLPASTRELPERGGFILQPISKDQQHDLALPRDKSLGDVAAGASLELQAAPSASAPQLEKAAAGYLAPAAPPRVGSAPSSQFQGNNAGMAASSNGLLPYSAEVDSDGSSAQAGSSIPMAASTVEAVEMQDALRRRGVATPSAIPPTAPAIANRSAINGAAAQPAETPPAETLPVDATQSRLSLDKSLGQAMVVHVQVTQQAWQDGHFHQLLAARQIAWQAPGDRAQLGNSRKYANSPSAMAGGGAALAASGGGAGGINLPEAAPSAAPAANQALASKPSIPMAKAAAPMDKPAALVPSNDARGTSENLADAEDRLATQNDIQLIYLDAPEPQLQLLLADLRSAAHRQDSIASFTVTSHQGLTKQFKAAEASLMAASAPPVVDPQQRPAAIVPQADGLSGHSPTEAPQPQSASPMNRELQARDAKRRSNNPPEGELANKHSDATKPGKGEAKGEAGDLAKLLGGPPAGNVPPREELAKQTPPGSLGRASDFQQLGESDEIAPLNNPLSLKLAQSQALETEGAAKKASPHPVGLAIRLQGDDLQNFRKADLPPAPTGSALAGERRALGIKTDAQQQAAPHVEALFIIQIVPARASQK